MAACHEKLRQFEEMADAGRSCIKADKSFVKGYFRLAVAYKNLNQLGDCIQTLQSGLAIQSSNPDLKRMKKEVTELQRGEQVAAFCGKAEEMMQNGDISGAMKQLDFASRLDAGNADIERMMAKIKPKFDAMERKRKANMTPTEKFKEQGDASYKNANFEEAVTHYTKCLDQLQSQGKSGSDLALKAYANRAGEYCNKQEALCLFQKLCIIFLRRSDAVTDESRFCLSSTFCCFPISHAIWIFLLLRIPNANSILFNSIG